MNSDSNSRHLLRLHLLSFSKNQLVHWSCRT